MAISKNKGPILRSRMLGGESPIPPEFRAAMERVEVVQAVPNDTALILLGNTVIESRLDCIRTDEFVSHTIQKKPGDIVLRATNTNDQGQPVQVVRTMFLTGTGTPAIPNATTSVSIRDLGDGQSIQEVSQEGTYAEDGTFTPEVFDERKETRQVNEIIPARFLAGIENDTLSVQVAGTDPEPADLGDGVFGVTQSSSERVTAFKLQNVQTSRAPSLPISFPTFGLTTQFGGGTTTITEKFDAITAFTADPGGLLVLDYALVHEDGTYASEKKESLNNPPSVLSGIEIIESSGIAVSYYQQVVPPTSTGSAESTGYSDSKPLDIWRTQTSTHNVISRPNPVEVRQTQSELVPSRFLLGVPVTTTITRVATDDVTPATLGDGITGIIESSVERFNVYENRKTKEERTIELPILQGGGKVTTEFGGGVLAVEDSLLATSPSVVGGLAITNHEFQKLSETLYVEHKESLPEGEWPILSGTLVDETTGIVFNYTKQVVAAGTAGGVVDGIYTEVQPLDKWRSIAISTQVDPDSLPGAVTYTGLAEVKDPDSYSTTAYTATSGIVYSESRSFSRSAGLSGPVSATIERGYVMEADLGTLSPGTPRRMSSGNTTSTGVTYAASGDVPYAQTFSWSEPQSDTVSGSTVSFQVTQLRFGVYQYTKITV